jgi:hypothetical protein
VTADRVAANGDFAGPVGLYALALAAKVSNIPFLVAVATTAIDPAVPDLDDLTVEDARPSSVISIKGQRLAPEGVHIRNPVTDVVPADLVTAYITDEGVLRVPFAESIAAAHARSSERRTAARGYRAMLEQQRKAAEEAAVAGSSETETAKAERQAAIREMASGLLAAEPAPAPHEDEPVPADEPETPAPGDLAPDDLAPEGEAPRPEALADSPAPDAPDGSGAEPA